MTFPPKDGEESAYSVSCPTCGCGLLDGVDCGFCSRSNGSVRAWQIQEPVKKVVPIQELKQPANYTHCFICGDKYPEPRAFDTGCANCTNKIWS